MAQEVDEKMTKKFDENMAQNFYENGWDWIDPHDP